MEPHNIHSHQLVLDSVPDHARESLDVGYGEGILARWLRHVLPDVPGLKRAHRQEHRRLPGKAPYSARAAMALTTVPRVARAGRSDRSSARHPRRRVSSRTARRCSSTGAPGARPEQLSGIGASDRFYDVFGLCLQHHGGRVRLENRLFSTESWVLRHDVFFTAERTPDRGPPR